jgi:hypothetical protein
MLLYGDPFKMGYGIRTSGCNLTIYLKTAYPIFCPENQNGLQIYRYSPFDLSDVMLYLR